MFERLCCGKRSGFLIIIKCSLLSVQLAVIFNAVQLDDIHRAKKIIYDTVLQIIKKKKKKKMKTPFGEHCKVQVRGLFCGGHYNTIMIQFNS